MPQQRLLLVEDEPAIADTLLYALKTEGFDPRWVTTGAEGLKLACTENWALMVLDVGLPDMSGFEVCRRLRAKSTLPVLFLTARSGEIDRIVGLELGADDYVVKPFSPRELCARVRAILRRGSHQNETVIEGEKDISQVAGLHLDDARCQIRYHEEPLQLTRMEYRLLRVFIRRPGHVMTREALLEAAWDEPEASTDRTVDAHIKSIRAKLKSIRPKEDPIETHRGLGYSLRET